MKTLFVSLLLASLALVPSPQAARAADAPQALKWAELVPKNTPAAAPARTFFSGSTKADDSQAPPPPLAEGKFMTTKRRQPGGDAPPAVVPELNGKLVSIGGYLVPLDFESTSIKEFLLVPFVGACIHVPPPPTNQIVYVKFPKGLEITGQFDPVTVVGTLKTETAFTGLADAGYSLEADSVTVMQP